jgi:hypothetical protein
MGQKALTQKHQFAAKFPRPAPNQLSEHFFGKADRSLLYAPGQYAPLFQSGQGQLCMGVFLEHGFYAFTFNYGFFVSSLSRDSGIELIWRNPNPVKPDFPDILRAHSGKFGSG